MVNVHFKRTGSIAYRRFLQLDLDSFHRADTTKTIKQNTTTQGRKKKKES
jgi:hypothetical protein